MSEETQFQKIELEIIYEPIESNNDKIRIFGKNFVNNNKDKCKIIYKNMEYEFKENFEDIDHNYDYSDNILLKLRIFKNINDMSFMFYGCNSLVSFSEKAYSEDSQQENNIKINQYTKYKINIKKNNYSK